MVNYHANFRQLLLDAVNNEYSVYYDKFEEKTQLPCISYLEISNTTTRKGDTLKYSNIAFQVKIWAESLQTIISLSNKIDTKLEACGFRRGGSAEIMKDGIISKTINYNAIGFEKK